MKIISLGSVTFDDIVEQGLYIEEEYKWLPVGQTIKYTLEGSAVVIENHRSGKPLTLIAQEDRGWIKKESLLNLITLASQVNAVHVLTLVNDEDQIETRNVRFKRDSYPLDLNPLDPGHLYFVGSIRLIQV